MRWRRRRRSAPVLAAGLLSWAGGLAGAARRAGGAARAGAAWRLRAGERSSWRSPAGPRTRPRRTRHRRRHGSCGPGIAWRVGIAARGPAGALRDARGLACAWDLLAAREPE